MIRKAVQQGRKKGQCGFSLVELAIVLAIVGILAGVAGPQFGSFIKRQSLLSESRRITSLIKVARAEARARGSFVTMSNRNGVNWGGNIDVYENVAAPYNDLLTNVDELIRASDSSGRILAAVVSPNTQFLVFNTRGWPVAGNFQITVCTAANDPTDGRIISVNRVGKIVEGPINGANCN